MEVRDPRLAEPCSAQEFRDFYARAEQCNRGKTRKKVEDEIHLRWPALKYRSPPTLHGIDRRFCHVKFDRVFVCDTCGDVVRFSKATRQTGFRVENEFAGNFDDDSWKHLDYSLREEAWRKGLIDARWSCQRNCGAKPTGAGKERRERTHYGMWTSSARKRSRQWSWR